MMRDRQSAKDRTKARGMLVVMLALLATLCLALAPLQARAEGDEQTVVPQEQQATDQLEGTEAHQSIVEADDTAVEVSSAVESVELENVSQQTGDTNDSVELVEPRAVASPETINTEEQAPSSEEIVFTDDTEAVEPVVEAEAESIPVMVDEPILDEQASGDIILGMYFNSTKDWTNSIFASTDGQVYRRIATAYRQQRASDHAYKDSSGNWHYPQQTPSIVYYNGKFWCLSGWNRQNGKIWPTISYSTDLVHWTYPEGEGLITGTRGIAVDSLPIVNGQAYRNFDIVAPEWYISKNGGLYIIVSCGYYGDYHGRPTQDQMTAYIIKVTALSASAGRADGNTGYLWPVNLTFKAQTAKKLPFTNTEDFIDGAGYNNGDYDYLVIKRAGLYNQIYRTTNIDDVNAWRLVNGRASYGFEGASIAKLGSTYYMMTDKVEGVTATGNKLFKSSSISTGSAWSGPSEAVFLAENNQLLAAPRHGSLLTLKAGTEGWKVAKALLDKNPVKGKPMYRMYNPNSGEHFYTAAIAERDMLISVGWRYEGIGWFAPEKSNTPVYRLYNANAGDHHYTMNAAERDMLKRVGWKYEGIGWYSDDKRTTPLYRQYNPNARTGTHNYTTNRAENDMLVRVGWKAEGIGWYGL